MTLIKLHTMNSYLTDSNCLKLAIIFTLSQTSYHIHFVSNYPSYSLCLRPSVIFTLSHTIHHILIVSDHMSYLICLQPAIISTLKQAIIYTLFEANHHVQSVSTTMHSSVMNQILYVLSHSLDKFNTLVTLRQREYDMYLRQSKYDALI